MTKIAPRSAQMQERIRRAYISVKKQFPGVLGDDEAVFSEFFADRLARHFQHHGSLWIGQRGEVCLNLRFPSSQKVAVVHAARTLTLESVRPQEPPGNYFLLKICNARQVRLTILIMHDFLRLARVEKINCAIDILNSKLGDDIPHLIPPPPFGDWGSGLNDGDA